MSDKAKPEDKSEAISSARSYFPSLSYLVNDTNLEQSLGGGAPPPIGIDIGNQFTKAAFIHEGGIVQPLIFDGTLTFPSIAHFGDSEVNAGRSAVSKMEIPQEWGRAAICPMELIQGASFLPIPNLEIRPAHALTAILREVRRMESDLLSQDFGETCVLTHPTTFGTQQLAHLRTAAADASFKNVKFVQQPIAAAIACDALKFVDGNCFLVCDFGASRFECSVVTRNSDGLFHLALPSTVVPVGGDLIDEKVLDFFDQRARKELDCGLCESEFHTYHSKSVSRETKELLSTSKSTEATFLVNGERFIAEIGRSDFEPLISKLVDKYVSVADAMLNAAEKAKVAIDAAILLGGTQRIPLIREQFKNRLPLSDVFWNFTDPTMAYGAVIKHCIDHGAVRLKRKVSRSSSLTELVHQIQDEDNRAAEREKDAMNRENSKSCKAIESHFQQQVERQEEMLNEERERLAQHLADKEYSLVQDSLSHLLKIYPEDAELNSTQSFLDSRFEKIGEIRSGRFGDPANSIAMIDGSVLGWVCVDNSKVCLENFHTGATEEEISIKSANSILVDVNQEWILGAGKSIRKYSLPDGVEQQTCEHGGDVSAIAKSPDNLKFATIGKGSYVKVWNLKTLENICHLEGDFPNGSSVAFIDNNTVCASGGGLVYMWDLKTTREEKNFHCNQGDVHSICPLPNSKLLASGGQDGTIRLWDTWRGRELCRYEGHTNAVTSILFCSDGRHLVSASLDRTLKVWHSVSTRMVRSFEGLRNDINAIAISSNDQYLISADKAKDIKTWQLGVL